ncbi:MAG: formyltransferase family protein [Planctomycetota bacterium]
MNAPRTAFLLLEEHPYGREMLRQLLAAGFPPALVVEERSEVARVEREKFSERIGSHPQPPSVAELVRAERLPHARVPDHRKSECLAAVRAVEPELIVLGGTRILRGELLEVAPLGVLNCHPGLLPECRGSASPAWSVIHDLPVGSTCHFCDAGIDTGDLLLRRELPVRRGLTYEDLCHGTLVLSAELMVEAHQAYVEGRWDELRHPQGASEHPTFKNAPAEVLAQVRDKLERGTYAHLR